MTILKFKPCIDASGRIFRVIPTLEVYSNQDDLIVYEEPLKNFGEELCRKILIEHYGFSPTEGLYGAIEIKKNHFYLFKDYLNLKPDFCENEYFLSFDHNEYS